MRSVGFNWIVCFFFQPFALGHWPPAVPVDRVLLGSRHGFQPAEVGLPPRTAPPGPALGTLLQEATENKVEVGHLLHRLQLPLLPLHGPVSKVCFIYGLEEWRFGSFSKRVERGKYFGIK